MERTRLLKLPVTCLFLLILSPTSVCSLKCRCDPDWTAVNAAPCREGICDGRSPIYRGGMFCLAVSRTDGSERHACVNSDSYHNNPGRFYGSQLWCSDMQHGTRACLCWHQNYCNNGLTNQTDPALIPPPIIDTWREDTAHFRPTSYNARRYDTNENMGDFMLNLPHHKQQELLNQQAAAKVNRNPTNTQPAPAQIVRIGGTRSANKKSSRAKDKGLNVISHQPAIEQFGYPYQSPAYNNRNSPPVAKTEGDYLICKCDPTWTDQNAIACNGTCFGRPPHEPLGIFCLARKEDPDGPERHACISAESYRDNPGKFYGSSRWCSNGAFGERGCVCWDKDHCSEVRQKQKECVQTYPIKRLTEAPGIRQMVEMGAFERGVEFNQTFQPQASSRNQAAISVTTLPENPEYQIPSARDSHYVGAPKPLQRANNQVPNYPREQRPQIHNGPEENFQLSCACDADWMGQNVRPCNGTCSGPLPDQEHGIYCYAATFNDGRERHSCRSASDFHVKKHRYEGNNRWCVQSPSGQKGCVCWNGHLCNSRITEDPTVQYIPLDIPNGEEHIHENNIPTSPESFYNNPQQLPLSTRRDPVPPPPLRNRRPQLSAPRPITRRPPYDTRRNTVAPRQQTETRPQNAVAAANRRPTVSDRRRPPQTERVTTTDSPKYRYRSEDLADFLVYVRHNLHKMPAKQRAYLMSEIIKIIGVNNAREFFRSL